MTLKEYNERLKKAVSDVETSIGETMVKLGSSALALIRQRVQETGTDAAGKKFNSYSERPALTNRTAMTTSAYSKIAGSKTKRRDLKWVTLQRGGRNIKLFQLDNGYKQFRELHGRQTNFVDFTFFGSMWGNIGIISNKSQHDSGLVTIGPATDEEMKKLEGNVKRKGQILDLSDEELSSLAKDFELDTLRIMRNNGL